MSSIRSAAAILLSPLLATFSMANATASPVEDCRVRLLAIEEFVADIDSETVRMVEAARVGPTGPGTKRLIRKLLQRDSKLGSTLRRKDREELARRLLEERRRHRSFPHVTGRFLDEKGHARGIARTISEQRKHQRLMLVYWLRVLSRQNLILEVGDAFGDRFVDEALTLLEESVYSDPELLRDPKAYLERWKAHLPPSPLRATPEHAALQMLQALADDPRDGLEKMLAVVVGARLRSLDQDRLSRRWTEKNL